MQQPSPLLLGGNNPKCCTQVQPEMHDPAKESLHSGELTGKTQIQKVTRTKVLQNLEETRTE